MLILNSFLTAGNQYVNASTISYETPNSGLILNKRNVTLSSDFKKTITDATDYLNFQFSENQGNLEIIQALHGVKNEVANINDKITQMFNSKSLEFAEKYKSELRESAKIAKEKAQAIIDNGIIDEFDFQETIDVIEIIHQDMTESQKYLSNLIREIEIIDDVKKLSIDSNNSVDTILENLAILKKVSHKFSEVAIAQTKDVISKSIIIIPIMSFIALVLSITIAFLITKAIINPLNNMMATVKTLSEGNLTIHVKTKSKDEFGTLAECLEVLIQQLKTIITNIISCSEQVAEAAAENSAVSNSTLDIVEQQKEYTSSAATSMSEASITVEDIASNTDKTLAEVTKTKKISTEGRDMVINTANNIQLLTKKFEETSNTVNSVQENVKEISSILDVVRGIAEQTNLLALNAAIEAARAGEQGRGFAVVADEVRTLAAKTQQSTGEIQKMISNLQQGTNKAVNSMKQSVDTATDTRTNAIECGEQLKLITDSMVRVLDMTTLISSAAEEQSAVARDIAAKLADISDISVKTSMSAAQTSENSELLNTLSKNLKKNVAFFKVTE